MKPRTLTITTPEGTRELSVPASTPSSLAELLRQKGLPLNTRCGQRGLCDGCAVHLFEGQVKHLLRDEVTAGPAEVRACRVTPASDLSLSVPQRAMLSYQPQVVDGYAIRITHAHDPISPLPLGLAIDVGTTTVAVLLVDLVTGAVLAKRSAFNAQMHLGDDVVTRISLCMQDHANLFRFQQALTRGTLVPLITQALAQAGRQASDIGAITVAGNTTMLHLLAGEDPSPLGVSPFTPRFVAHRVLNAQSLLGTSELNLSQAQLHLLPSASAYIGADIVAGLVATGMAYESDTTLLVDVGTNGEIVLQHEGRLLACATAAGPAFEGSRLAAGMRAGHGAITAITLHADGLPPTLTWLGDPKQKPAGLCGSAYIDFLAQGRACGLLSPTGRYLRRAGDEARFEPVPSGLAYRLTQGQGGRPILISDCDVASLLAAKAAIAAGIALLLETAGIPPTRIERLYLAGGFGTHMNAANAIAIGLLPGFTPAQIHPVGNTSLAGALLMLTDQSLQDDMTTTARAIQTVELNQLPQFEDAYIDALMLP